MELICKGRFKSSDLNRVLDGHLGKGSILCTDSHKGYLQFVKDFDLEHKRIKSGRHLTDDLYSIQRLNSFHSRLKTGWIDLMEFQLNILQTIYTGLSGLNILKRTQRGFKW